MDDHSLAPSGVAPRRPFSVTLLALGVLTIASLALWRLVSAIQSWAFAAEFSPPLPLYLAFSGLIWSLIGLPLAWGVWRGRPWAPRWTRLFAVAYALYHWLDRLLVSNRAVTLVNWPFALALTGILLAFVLLSLAHCRSRAFFRA